MARSTHASVKSGAIGLMILLFASPVWGADQVLKIGIAAMISPKETFKYYSEIVEYIGTKLDRKVMVEQRENYDEMDRLLESNEVTIAFICSGPYVKDRDKFGVELLAAPQSYGQPFYYAYILVPAGSPAAKFDDLRGKRFAFTDPKSNTGALVPTYMVAKRFNAKPADFFSEVIYSKSHDNSIEAVANNKVDGASVDSLIFDYAVKKKPELAKSIRIIEKSPPYGIPPIVTTKAMDSDLKNRILRILLTMHEDTVGKAVLDAIMVDKFIIPKDSDYDSVREMRDWVDKAK